MSDREEIAVFLINLSNRSIKLVSKDLPKSILKTEKASHKKTVRFLNDYKLKRTKCIYPEDGIYELLNPS